MLKKFKILITISIILLTASCFKLIVNADTGPKPSITIKLKNIKTNNYLIDLLVYDETGETYNSPLDYNGNEEQYSTRTGYNDLKTIKIEELNLLHKINYDGWISESTRWDKYLLFADCNGNSKHKHRFSYFGTPETYKVIIIDKNTGKTKVTNIIHREEFTSNITIDVNNMNVEKTLDFGTILIGNKDNIIALITTIIIEISIALIMKIKKIKTIVLENILTNTILQLALMYIPAQYIITFIFMEILVIIIEYLINKKLFKEISKNRIITYTLIANIISALVTFIIK